MPPNMKVNSQNQAFFHFLDYISGDDVIQITGGNQSINVIAGSGDDIVNIHNSRTAVIVGDLATVSKVGYPDFNLILESYPPVDLSSDKDIIMVQISDEYQSLFSDLQLENKIRVIGGHGNDTIQVMGASFVHICGDFCKCKSTVFIWTNQISQIVMYV
jgi:hypothetical protein